MGTIGPMNSKQTFTHLCNLLVLQVSAAVCFWVQEEYEREGVDVRQVGYQDNRPLLELLLSVSAVSVWEMCPGVPKCHVGVPALM